MAATICPAVLASTPEEFQTQMITVSRFAVRVHIDLADGKFASSKTIPIDQVWWPGGVRADLHVMFKRPFDHLPAMLTLQPQMIIVHAEAEGDFETFADIAHKQHIETGVALLPNTPAELLRQALPYIDHVLVFSGNLGHYGGTADLRLLDKVKQLKQMKPQLEIGWDGGVNPGNARQLMQAGVEVLNTGGFIHHAEDPHAAYMELRRAISASQRPSHADVRPNRLA
jgi:ribulose-phosphate 3-epimerase